MGLPLHFSRRTFFALFLALCGVATASPPSEPTDMPMHETKYYRVYTDLDPADAQEACIRVTKMAEEYHNRTAGFSGEIRAKFPFYLFKNVDEYHAAGGMPNTGGFFDGSRLMAVGDIRLGGRVWHIVQHEGFHQFAGAVIGGELPIWVDEGMAEYFGEGIFTGDGMVTGIIPPERLLRVVQTMDLPPDSGGFHPLRGMMGLSHKTWNAEISQQNYDQAWSMVQFLAHGDDGKYQNAFGQYISLVSHGSAPQTAWDSIFGADTDAFDQRWRSFWKSLPSSPTSELYLKATIATLGSFLGRAFDQKQTFESFDSFESAAEEHRLRAATDEWLPPSLLESAFRRLDGQKTAGDKFSLTFTVGNHIPQIVCDSAEGQHFVGRFTLRDNHVTDVTVTITGSKKKLEPQMGHR